MGKLLLASLQSPQRCGADWGAGCSPAARVRLLSNSSDPLSPPCSGPFSWMPGGSGEEGHTEGRQGPQCGGCGRTPSTHTLTPEWG